MAQKINPISLRLEKTNRSMDSSWFNQSNYVILLMKDLKIQWYMNLILKKIQFCSARYSIKHLPTKIKINIFFCNPNKNRKYISKIFYLSKPKKVKTIKKNFFNKAHIGFSVKQAKVFKYLIKSFNDDRCKSVISNKHTNLLYNKTEIIYTNRNKNNSNNVFLFENYLKLLYFLKSYNQFYIRYFLIKYFSTKFPVNKNVWCGLHSVKKTHKNILFKCILGFLFLQIYKNKNFLALKYLNVKMNNYKKKAQNSNTIYKTLEKQKLDKVFYTGNLERKKNYNYLNLKSGCLKIVAATFNDINLQGKKNSVFFFHTFLQLKLKILSFLKKNTLNSIQLPRFYTKNNTELDFISRINSKKKFVPTFTDITGLLKLKTSCQPLQLYNRKRNFSSFLVLKSCNHDFKTKNNANNKTSYIVFNDENEKYYDLSLTNAQCINDIYNNYCKLFEFCQYYETIYLRANTSCNKKLFSLHENTVLKPHINLFQIDKKINNTISSSKRRIVEKQKCILPSSPYKSHMEAILCNHFSRNINFHFFQTGNIFQNAFFLIDEVIYYIEKRVPFFKIKNYILKKLAQQKLPRIKGIRVTCSGRIGGKSKKAQRSKVQNFKYGETSLHVFSSKIDFKSKNAFTSFGTLGVKIWICYH